MWYDNLNKLQDIIGVKFQNRNLLVQALTHKSYAVSVGKKKWNERLEFLGDSILSAIVSDYLYHRFPKSHEGTLSRVKSQLVSRQTLTRWGKQMNIGEYVALSPGEESTGGRTRDSLIANTFEALLGAIYLEKGYAVAEQFVLKYLDSGEVLTRDTDYKSQLQEISQKKYRVLPVYTVAKEIGPEHEKIFDVTVKIKKRILGKGIGKNKKTAEQQAAKQALVKTKTLF
jgi:ribonuclease-3